MTFKAVIHPEPSGGYWGEVPALTGCYSQGEIAREHHGFQGGGLSRTVVDDSAVTTDARAGGCDGIGAEIKPVQVERSAIADHGAGPESRRVADLQGVIGDDYPASE
jgi:hypothetical protein